MTGGQPYDVAVDCRWLGIWGAGRVTELLLQGLAEGPPDRRWALWGSPGRLDRYAWPGAVVVPDERDPRAWRGQRAWFGVPDAAVVLFGHQRPLRPVPAVTWIFDTIQLRHGGTEVERRVRRRYLRRLAAVSRTVLTISEHSRAAIERDLGVDPARISAVTLPVDWAQAERVRDLRRQHQPDPAAPPTALFVGRFAPHKNLPRLLAAFQRTEFRAGGGRLVLVGGSPDEVAAISASVTPTQRASVEVRGRCDDDALAALLARATLVVQPSLEEGFGLPVAEALAAGVPVCVSDGGALPEAAGAMAVPFPATSVEAMTAALDATAAAAADPAHGDRLVEDARRRFPSVAEFARSVRIVLDDC